MSGCGESGQRYEYAKDTDSCSRSRVNGYGKEILEKATVNAGRGSTPGLVVERTAGVVDWEDLGRKYVAKGMDGDFEVNP